MIFAWCPEGDPLLTQSVATCMIAAAATHSILNLRPLLRRRNLGRSDNNGDESVPCQSIYKGRERGGRWCPSGTCGIFGFSPMTSFTSTNGSNVKNVYMRPTASIAASKRERASEQPYPRRPEATTRRRSRHAATTEWRDSDIRWACTDSRIFLGSGGDRIDLVEYCPR